MPKTTGCVGVAAATVIGLMLATGAPIKASTILISETQLTTGNQVLSSPGPDNTQFANPLSVAYSGGTATFNGPLGYVERRTQNNGSAGSWNGNFAPDAPLFFTGVVDSPMELIFSTDVTEVGAQIQPFAFYGGFSANIIAYDQTDTVIGTFSVGGNSTAAGDNSATFIGIRLSTGDAPIRRVLFSTPGYGSAIGSISFASQQTAAVPEPSTYAMFGCGLLALFALGRRKRSTQAI